MSKGKNKRKKTQASCDDGACTNHAVCCKDTIVPITDTDVKRLMKVTGLPADEIIRLYSPSDLQYDTDHTWIRMGYGKRIIGLKKKGNRCKFLNDHDLCTVYDARPITCRTYPYMVLLDQDGTLNELELNSDVDCCGRLGSHWTKKRLLKDARQEDAEDDAYIDRLRAYEKRVRKGKNRGKQGLLKFLGLA
jgi:Fe-S-cluster containining protein